MYGILTFYPKSETIPCILFIHAKLFGQMRQILFREVHADEIAEGRH